MKYNPCLNQEKLTEYDIGQFDVNTAKAYRLVNIGIVDCYNDWQTVFHYLLCCYEEYLAKQKGQRFSNEQWNRIWQESAVKSIEQILPQSKGSLHDWDEGIFVHRLGNLLLLPPGLNSELGDKDPKAKVDAYQRTELLSAVDVAEMIQKDAEEWYKGWKKYKICLREEQISDWIDKEFDCG